VSTIESNAAEEQAQQRAARAAAIRAALLADPEFLALVRRSEEDIKAGRLVEMAEVERKYLPAE
jgi:hypothetical protein